MPLSKGIREYNYFLIFDILKGKDFNGLILLVKYCFLIVVMNVNLSLSLSLSYILYMLKYDLLCSVHVQIK